MRAPAPAHRSSAKSLRQDLIAPRSVLEQTLIKVIADKVQKNTGRLPTNSEKRSWLHSLSELARILDEAERGQVEILVEFPIPHCKRSSADAIIAGISPSSRKDVYIVVELKQWSVAESIEDDPELFTVPGLREAQTHPIRQVLGYRNQIADSLAVFDSHPDAIKAVAYLHEAQDSGVQDLFEVAAVEGVPLFTGTQRGAFIEYLRENLSDKPGRMAADRLLGSPVRPPQHLLQKASKVLAGLTQFDLIGQQQKAFYLVMHHVRKAYEANTKRVVIITGGPGSGKTAIAISLLKALADRRDRVAYATGSRTVTKTLRREVAKRDEDLERLFQYYMTFANSRRNDLDVLIADEAHRVRRRSFDRWRKEWRSDRPQIESIINAARVPVFLLDEHQVVKPDEVGTVEAIISHAQALNVFYEVVHLEGQWRCGGSAVYDSWVRRLLSLGTSDGEWDGDIGPQLWEGDDNFEILLVDSPGQMERILRDKIANGSTARITAGYCWEWSNPNDDGTLVPDIKINGWERPWNAKAQSGRDRVGDAPSSHFWATSPGGFEQVGCIYTAQGLEFDWAGVIIGPDLVARGGGLTTVREASKDRELTNSRVSNEQFRRLVRNVYKVLLTRGLSGVVIHAVDPETREFLSRLVTPRAIDH